MRALEYLIDLADKFKGRTDNYLYNKKAIEEHDAKPNRLRISFQNGRAMSVDGELRDHIVRLLREDLIREGTELKELEVQIKAANRVLTPDPEADAEEEG